MEIDDDVVGVAGYWMESGVAVVFSDLRCDVPKTAIWRGAKRFMDILPKRSVCDSTEASRPFLERLGWSLMYGNVYKYDKDSLT